MPLDNSRVMGRRFRRADCRPRASCGSLCQSRGSPHLPGGPAFPVCHNQPGEPSAVGKGQLPPAESQAVVLPRPLCGTTLGIKKLNKILPLKVDSFQIQGKIDKMAVSGKKQLSDCNSLNCSAVGLLFRFGLDTQMYVKISFFS